MGKTTDLGHEGLLVTFDWWGTWMKKKVLYGDSIKDCVDGRGWIHPSPKVN